MSDDELLGYGVPAEWLDDVKNGNGRHACYPDRSPASRSSGGLARTGDGRQAPCVLSQRGAAANPFDHPDAQRRFRVMANVEELERALDFPWEKWTVFLHPDQRQWVERDYGGPARVSGSAGTGKTIVALHRAAYLARTHPDARVLLTTFSDTLAYALQTKLKRLLGNEPRLAERIDVYSLNAIGLRLFKAHIGSATIAKRDVFVKLMEEAATAVDGHKFGLHFLLTEWDQVVDAWQLENWEAYRDVARLGRKTRLHENQRRLLWSIFEQVRADLKNGKLITHAELFTSLATVIAKSGNAPFDFAVVDEAQDISVSHLRFFAALVKVGPMLSFSRAIWVSASSSSHFRGRPSAWIFVDVRGRCASIIARRTKSACRRTGCLAR